MRVKSKQGTSRLNIYILVVIIGIAVLLAVLSYEYTTFISNRIVDIASQEIRSNVRIEAHDISLILANKLQTVGALLQTLAESPALHNNEYKRADIIINTRQNSSRDLTDFYMWLDKDGKINWISNINQSTFQKYKRTDLSYRPYFTIPKQTQTVYYSSLIESNDKVPRLYIAYPVINKTATGSGSANGNGNGILTGVVVTSVRLEALGSYLNNQLFPQFNSTVGLLDRNGIILYATGGQQYAGENVFGNKFQSLLSSSLHPAASKDLLNDMLRNSLKGATGIGDILINGKMSTIAYQPVVVNGKYFVSLYISAQHNLASDVSGLIAQQQYFTVLVVAVIGGVAVTVAFLVSSWNKRLGNAVNEKTGELKRANDSLAASNKRLELANEQLKTHDKMQNEFINIASHEMKTPTQAILGYSTLMMRHPEKRDEMLKALARNAVRLQRLTKDILDVTRIETRSLRLNLQKVNLNEIVCDIIEDQKTEIEKTKKEINLVLEPQVQTIEIDIDVNYLGQVISNLLTNAIKFTKKGTITTRTDIKDKNALVSITDEGPGIDPEIYPRLFTKFAAKSDTGTGLGLFISKSFVEAHGGKIWAENNHDTDGQITGATFTFSIPLSKVEQDKLNKTRR
jgi:signal transduction histidine kinase